MTLTATVELELIKRALYTDPTNLWFYHGYLMCTFDPRLAQETMAPNLTNDGRLTYVIKELETMQDLLEGAEDCKWIYQALLQYTTLEYTKSLLQQRRRTWQSG
jgi:geranylgeranyl transferase type-2 subunit alpha